ncbi:hypothetical protein D3C80_1315850 [compost metagenome]
MRRTFGRCQEPGADLHPLRTEGKRCGHAPTVSDSAGGNYGDRDRVRHLWNQRHRRSFTHMTARFCTFRHDCIDTESCHLPGDLDGGDHRDDNNAGGLPHLYVVLRRTRTGSYYFHPFINDQLCQLIVVRSHQHQINAERAVRQGPAFVNLFTQTFSAKSPGSNDTKPSGIRYSRSQLRQGNLRHRPLKDWILYTQQFGNTHEHSPIS